MDHIDVKVTIEGRGLTLDTLGGWPELRELLDEVVKALVAMPGGPRARDVLPIAIESGSVQPTLRIPRASRPAVHVLARGPVKAWSREMRRAAEPLYERARERNWSVKVDTGVRKPHVEALVVPTRALDWEIVERVGEVAEVLQVGGKDGTVVVRTDGGDVVTLHAGRDLARALGKSLYERVHLDLTRRVDVATGTTLGGTIESCRPAGSVSLAEWMREAADLGVIDVARELKVVRG